MLPCYAALNMKLLQLNVTANWGSTGKIAEGIGLAAIARDWESYIAYGRYMNPSKSQLIKVGNKFDVYAHYGRARFFDQEGLGSKASTRKLIADIDKITPDIIHLHNIHDHWLNYPIFFNYLSTLSTPVVWTFHDCWAFTGGCPHFESIGCYQWRDNSCKDHCPLKHRQAAKNFAKRYNAFSKIGERLHIVAVSKWLASYISESFFEGNNGLIEVINNGIDLDGVFKQNNENKENMILGVSNVWPEYKGLNDFIKLRSKLPDDIGITLVGLTKKQIESLPKGINGISRTTNASELATLYRKAKVFVNTTYNDSFPTVNLEALACGTPVITYRTGGSPEAIDEKTGIVIEKGDLSSLAKGIMTIISASQGYNPDNCRKRAESCFDKNIQFNKYIDLYENLIK